MDAYIGWANLGWEARQGAAAATPSSSSSAPAPDTTTATTNIEPDEGVQQETPPVLAVSTTATATKTAEPESSVYWNKMDWICVTASLLGGILPGAFPATDTMWDDGGPAV